MIEVSRIGPGRAFGELGLIYNQPRSATVVADGNLIATRLERSHYLELFAEFHTQKLFKVRPAARGIQPDVLCDLCRPRFV